MRPTPPRSNPTARAAAGDPWYVDDQLCTQLETPAFRAVVEGRWLAFEELFCRWARDRSPGSATRAIRVLDAGCGDGVSLMGLSRMVARLGWAARLFGVDYSPLRLARASRGRLARGLAAATLQQLPFPDGAFDAILCCHVIEHVADDRSALLELRRVLSVGGLLVLATPNEGCALARMRNRVLQPSIARTTDHVHFYTAESLKAKLVRAGWRVLRTESEGFFFPHLLLAGFLGARAWGRRVADRLLSLVPSQAAGLIVACAKEPTDPGEDGVAASGSTRRPTSSTLR